MQKGTRILIVLRLIKAQAGVPVPGNPFGARKSELHAWLGTPARLSETIEDLLTVKK
jgi:hypothetical protein